MTTEIRSFCRLIVLAVLILLAVQYNVIYGQDSEWVCSRLPNSINIISDIVSDFSQIDKGFERNGLDFDVWDYFERAQLRNRLVARAQSYLNRPENRTPARRVESMVLVVEGLLNFGLSPDDLFLTDQMVALQAMLRSEDGLKDGLGTRDVALICRTVQNYRQALVQKRLVPRQSRAVAASDPISVLRRASALSGTLDVSPAELRLLACWESDNARLADVPMRLRPATPQPLTPERQIAVAAGAAPSSSGSSNGAPDSAVSSWISSSSILSATALRSTRTQGFILFAQTVVLRV